jgi:hypothetical protein
MAGIYGSAWLSQFPTTELLNLSKSEWSAGLASCSDDQIAQGIDKAIKSGATMPPTLPKFLGYVMGSGLHKTAAYRVFTGKALPKLKTESQKVANRAAFQEIKKKLGTT